MNKEQAKTVVKSINRRVRRHDLMGGRGWPDYGVDYATWNITYPHLSSAYHLAGQVLMDRPGRFMPRFR